MSAAAHDSPNSDTSNPTKDGEVTLPLLVVHPNTEENAEQGTTSVTSPTGSSGAKMKGFQTNVDVLDNLAKVAEDNDVEDTHSCGKCQLIFTSLQAYIQHKLLKDNCKVTYTKQRRTLIPRLEIKKEKMDKGYEKYTGNDDTGNGPKKPKRGRPAGSRMKLHHNQEDIIDSSHRYKCEKCERTFIREAALRRHIEYDHNRAVDSEDEGDEEDDEDGTDRYRPRRHLVKKLKTEPQDDSSVQFIPATDSAVPQEEGDVPVIGHISLGQIVSTSKAEPLIYWPDRERPYECRQCGKTFKEAAVLKAHKLTHSEVRSFACTHRGCIFAFKTKGSLTRHLRRHTGERPFKCEKCGRRFGESGALTRHLKSRVSCTEKTDADLPRYGKKISLNQDVPTTCQHSLSQSETVTEVQPVQGQVGETGSGQQQVILQEIPAETFIKVIRIDNVGETNVDSVTDFEMVVETNGVDGAPGEEEVIEEAALPSASPSRQEELDKNHAENEEDATEAGDDAGEIRVIEVDLEEQAVSAAAAAVNNNASSSAPSQLVLNIGELDSNMCIVCQATCADKDSLREHLKSHLNTFPFKCSFCTYSAGKREDLELHLQITHQRRFFKGEGQSETVEELNQTVLLDQLAQQVKENVQQQQQQASEDTQEQSRQASLALQQLLAIQETGQSEQTETDIDPGSGESPAGKLATHTCPVCGRVFKGSSYLSLHMRSHTGERPHQCSVCEKTFMSKDTLTKHVATHSNERNFKCGECGKLFKRISHVREHLKVHSSERPFPCTVCDKSFKSANALKVHLRTHTDILPYRCNQCLRQFRERSSLERHVRTHTGEKPFQCPHCHRSFSEQGTLSRHLKSKVPCTKQLQFLHTPITITPTTQTQRLQQLQPDDLHLVQSLEQTAASAAVESAEHSLQVVTEVTEVTEVTASADGEDPQQQRAQEEISSVLAEFSLVADTQQYIIATDQVEGTLQQQTSQDSVILTENEAVQNVEVITQDSEDLTQVEEIHDTEYILLSHTGDKLTVLNRHTGETLEMRSTDTIIREETAADGEVITMEVGPMVTDQTVDETGAMQDVDVLQEDADATQQPEEDLNR